MKALRPSIYFWWSCWSCLLWLPSLFIFGAFRRGFKGIGQAVMTFTPSHKSFLWRLIKRFNFKLPNYVPPLEVAQEREQEPFMTETSSPRPAPPFQRTPSSPSPPPEVVPINIYLPSTPFLSMFHLQPFLGHWWITRPGQHILLQYATTHRWFTWH